jgi:hypothetical protein
MIASLALLVLPAVSGCSKNTSSTPQAQPEAANPSDPVVARVNGVAITQSDLAMAEEDLGNDLQGPPDHKREQLIAMVRAQVLMHADYPLLAMVANTELHCLSPEKAAAALEMREQARNLLYSALRRGANAGYWPADPSGDMILPGIAIGSMGIRVATWFGPDQPYTREQVADAFAAYALRLVGSTP